MLGGVASPHNTKGVEMNFLIGIIKKIKWLLASPSRQQKVVFISETGVISLEILPMVTGYISYGAQKMSWLVMHVLKGQLQSHDEPILRISERSYYPLDPFSRLSAEERKQAATLNEIAKTKYKEELARIGEEENQNAGTISTIIWGFLGLMALIIIYKVLRG